MYALASNVTGAGSVESLPASLAKYAAAAGKPPPYSVSSPTRTSGRAAQRIAHRHFLRRGDDDRGADVHRLGERELCVAGPGRQVHEKVVELSPIHILHELLNHLHDDRPTPDGGRVPLDDERERHEL